MKMAYFYLALAIIIEVSAAMALKASEGFTKPIPTAIVIVGYLTAFYLLTVIVKTLPIGITYAIWAGMDIVLVTIVSAFMYRQMVDLPAIIGMGLIISGVITINVFSKTVMY